MKPKREVIWNTKARKHQYYLTAYAKPEVREQKRAYSRESYHMRKALGICPIIGCVHDPVEGGILCEVHREKHRKKKKKKEAA